MMRFIVMQKIFLRESQIMIELLSTSTYPVNNLK